MRSPLSSVPLFHLGLVPISEAVAVTWALMAALTLGAIVVTRRWSLVPSKPQAIAELIVDAMDDQIRDTMQIEPGPYRAFIGTLFVFIFVAKLNAEGAAMLAGTEPGGDIRALQELLAANAIEANGVPVLSAQIARFTTQKVVETSSQVSGLAYSPDGTRIATAQFDGTALQWNSTNGKPAVSTALRQRTGAEKERDFRGLAISDRPTSSQI